ncbi:Uracil-DNA glycosylase [Vanrija pseudolonga]|uniref:Uracil-DNA glycosylase n=1 Tax=Vanrija pseudolonga TaxID=143232 RepID=A0AAF0Y202_9TREE|nr:Uracil-DNA glycosylase [Vanrija pseudolonga]
MPPKSIAGYFKPLANAPAAAGTKRGLSDNARKAIAEAKEPAAKKSKVENGATVPNGAVAASSAGRASTRAELREALKTSHAKAFPLLELELDTLGEDWLVALQDELTKPYFLALKEFVVAEQKSKQVFPPAADIYTWSRLCPLKDVRVVIVGQDPYHDDNQAHGLAFSVRKGVKIPPSLRNIYKEMATEVPGFKVPLHGDLTEWAKHGVLLLNTSLTVRAHEAGSHANRGWDQFTAAVLKAVTTRSSSSSDKKGANGVVFMAWGAHAQKMAVGLDKKQHLVLKSAHPSPLSASRGFFGNGHFNQSNDWLRERYGPDGVIDWKGLGA